MFKKGCHKVTSSSCAENAITRSVSEATFSKPEVVSGWNDGFWKKLFKSLSVDWFLDSSDRKCLKSKSLFRYKLEKINKVKMLFYIYLMSCCMTQTILCFINLLTFFLTRMLPDVLYHFVKSLIYILKIFMKIIYLSKN